MSISGSERIALIRDRRWPTSAEFFAIRNGLEPSALRSATLPSKTIPVSYGRGALLLWLRACVRDNDQSEREMNLRSACIRRPYVRRFSSRPVSIGTASREEEFPEQDTIYLDEHVPRALITSLWLQRRNRLG